MTDSVASNGSEAIEPPLNPKNPKSRHPEGLREKILKTQLPKYSGPYGVGMIDLEIPVREPKTFSDITRQHQPLLKLETILMSIYYPSAFGSGNGPAPDGGKKWSRPTWLPRPRRELAKGYGKFAGLPPWFMTAFFATTSMFTKIPAFRNAPLAEHWPPAKNSRQAGYDVKNTAGIRPEGEDEKPTFPLLIFSHGLGGTRTTYSTVNGEFASYGFVVVAIEHRDGSGPRTFVNLPHDENHPAKALFNDQDRHRGYRTMDYVFPKHNAYDTSPANQVDRELREAQIELRLAEIEEAYHVLSQICNGMGGEVAQKNIRVSGKHGASSRGLQGVEWERWINRFDLNEVTMLGHSFGAATTIEVLRHIKDRFSFIGQGILYDPWGAPIQPLDTNPEFKIDTPILCINSEAFMYWPDNFKMIMSLCQEAKQNDKLVWMMTVRGSIHISQSDFTLIYPHICSVLLKMSVNPIRAIDLNINASLEFLSIVMKRFSAMNRGDNEHLLEVAVLDDLPTDRKPPEKWMAMRLEIPHEFTLRLTPRAVRKHELKKAERRAPKDPNGKVLIGLEDFSVGGEIFMHAAPTTEELKKHGLSPTTELQTHQETGMANTKDYDGQRTGSGAGIEQIVMDQG